MFCDCEPTLIDALHIIKNSNIDNLFDAFENKKELEVYLEHKGALVDCLDLAAETNSYVRVLIKKYETEPEKLRDELVNYRQKLLESVGKIERTKAKVK